MIGGGSSSCKCSKSLRSYGRHVKRNGKKLVEGEFLQNIVSSILDLELKIHIPQARHLDGCS